VIKFYKTALGCSESALPPPETIALTKTIFRPRWLAEHNAKKRVVVADDSTFGWDWQDP
jgi:hypothetical protein